jgi:hypothetical protein
MDLNDITYTINGAVFEVNRELGPGFLEKVHVYLCLSVAKQKWKRWRNSGILLFINMIKSMEKSLSAS